MSDRKRCFAGARVVDGTGAPWYRGSVVVEDGAIAAVHREPEPDVAADETIDVDGAVLAPGFVDSHSHSDLQLLAEPTLAAKTRQGVTTEVVGQDGFSMAPMHREGGAAEWTDHLTALAGDVDVDWTWGGVGDYLDAIEATGVAPNVATLVGHGTARYDVLGMSDRAPDDAELERMAELVRAGLDDGAVGFSTGLVYAPQVNADTAEVRRLAEAAAPFGRPFVAHIRSEGRFVWEALDEFVDVGAAADVPIHLSHYKVSGRDQQGKAERANHLLEAARERGVDVTAEQYPYTAANTMLSTVLPPWVHAGGPEETRERLADPDARERMVADVRDWRIEGWENPGARTGWENLDVVQVSSEAFGPHEGESVAEIAAARGTTPVETVCDVLLADGFGVTMILHSMAERDVREILTNERVAVASDGIFGAHPHPRLFGTFPRVLGHYVREANLLSLEAAVRKMTSLPARVFGLDRKGLVRPGMDADLVVFDPAAVASRATFDEPRRHPVGIEHVVVDGEFVVRDGEPTGATPGRAIRA